MTTVADENISKSCVSTGLFWRGAWYLASITPCPSWESLSIPCWVQRSPLQLEFPNWQLLLVGKVPQDGLSFLHFRKAVPSWAGDHLSQLQAPDLPEHLFPYKSLSSSQPSSWCPHMAEDLLLWPKARLGGCRGLSQHCPAPFSLSLHLPQYLSLFRDCAPFQEASAVWSSIPSLVA